ncbi:hypothetical protein WJX72_005371 [[Myrmecia] bisecta]|uniref:START domain-containing protein n=1 Tax=[Myrmecia] bisecta TaxID=41462 RepID=A0AAW1QQN9_9CHLO
MVRDRHTSTLWALAAGRYEKKRLYHFTVSWPKNSHYSRDDLTLAWEEEELALRWREAFKGAILDLKSEHALETPRSTFTEASEGLDQSKASVGERRRSESGDASFHASLPRPEEDNGVSWQPPKRKWANFRHVNGVAVYQEAEGPDGQGGAFMVSAVVRSHPRAAFKALMDGDAMDMPFQLNACVLESLDQQSRIIKGNLEPTGLLSKVCAAREVVVQQTWREDDDGTFIVLMRSTKHRKAREPSAGWLGYQPIRAQVAAAGFTIAPLRPRFLSSSGSSNECLVTMVLKLDLGGWLSEASRVGWLLAPLAKRAVNSFLEPMLMSVISLRDKVEQERFVVKPFSMGQQTDPDQYEKPAARADSWVPPSKTFTLGSRKLTSLLGSQRLSGEDSGPASEPLTTTSAAGPSVAAAIVAEGSIGDARFASGTLDPKYWSCPGAAGYKVRGVNYLKDKKKADAEEPVFGLASVDLVDTDAPTFHIAQHLPSIRNSKAPFTFVVQLMVPGPPYLSLTMAWAADHDPCMSGKPQTPNTAGSVNSTEVDSDDELGRAPFDLCLARFLAGDDAASEARRHRTFKLIPSVVKGSWVIKQSVGNTPVLLGRKLTTRYFRGPGYFEVDVDVGSSRAASSVVGLVSGATTSLVIDMAILLEGHTADELPEFLLGTVRFAHLDLKEAAFLDTERGKIHPKGT